MNRISHRVLAIGAALSVTACGAPPPATPPPKTLSPAAQVEQLGRVVERYWAESAALAPWTPWSGGDSATAAAPGENISSQSLADALAIERRYYTEVSAIARATLDAPAALTYDIFLRERALDIEGFTYPRELLPVNPYEGTTQQFALLATLTERAALSNPRDFDKWRVRAQQFARWTQQAIANMREGLRRGYTVPRVLVEKELPQLAVLAADTPSNPFNEALKATSGAPPAETSPALIGVIRDDILPAYRALHEFLQTDYLPRARTSVGLSALPLGAAWYAYLVERNAGTGASAAPLHALGETEVGRLRQQIRALLAEIEFAGDAQSYFDRLRLDPRGAYPDAAAQLGAYQDLKAQVSVAATALFAGAPHVDFEIRAVEAYRAASSAPLSYRPRAPNDLIPALLYVNGAAPRANATILLPAQFFREAIPGRHYQSELQRERADLPRFRRFGGDPAFVEGWALYAVTLGGELAAYRDAEARYGALLAQLNCAAGLVIDTGLHAQSWTRQQALDYLHAEVPMDPDAALERVDRAIALPGDALACTVGFLKLQALRSWAQQAAGANFDERAYHTELLRDGAMPLDLLEAKLHAWVPAAVSASLAAAAAAAAGAASAAAAPAAAAPPGGATR